MANRVRINTRIKAYKQKIQMFEKELQLEHLSMVKTYDNRDYFEQAEGAFAILQILGIDTEYIRWSVGK